MSKPRTKELISGIVLSILGVPSESGIIKMICRETLCSSTFQNDIFNGCWYCTLASIILLLGGIFLILDAFAEWT